MANQKISLPDGDMMIKYDYATDPVVPEPDTEEDTLE